jgi:hypothetical protein
MFGHQNDQQNQPQNDTQIPDQVVDSIVNDDSSPPAQQSYPQFQPPAPLETPMTPPSSSPVSTPGSDPLSSDLPAATDLSTTVTTDSTDTPTGTSLLDVDAQSEPIESVDTNQLLDIKQEALSKLSPLVGHLEQTPEEKFRTTMMMIQASDNQSLIKDAYAAAQDIEDEKAKAQALLDIVNEINYFTQHHEA